MDFNGVIAAYCGGEVIKGAWLGKRFCWPDPWSDTWTDDASEEGIPHGSQ